MLKPISAITIITVLAIGMFATAADAVTFTWNDTNTPQPGTYDWFAASSWDMPDGIPTDGVGNLANAEQGNNNITININNGGNDVNLPNSTIRFGRGNYVDLVGADDEIIGDTLQINGAGGAPPVFDVAVTGNTVTSNRHGGVFNVASTLGTINSQGNHQQKWIFNATPTAALTSIRMADNDDRGKNHDDNFTVNVDMSTLAFDLEWGRVTVASGTTFDVGDLQITFDADWETINGGDGVFNQVVLDGDMTASSLTFENIDTGNNTTLAPQAAGTYGRDGLGGVDFNVSWITGDGVLTVIPEPASLALLGIGGLLMLRRHK